MNIAFARNEYKQTKVTRITPKNDGYEAVKFALEQIYPSSMQTLQTTNNPETKEHHFERPIKYILSTKMFRFRKRRGISRKST